MKKFVKRLRRIIPYIHNLPNVVYVDLLGYEWYIEKRR